MSDDRYEHLFDVGEFDPHYRLMTDGQFILDHLLGPGWPDSRPEWHHLLVRLNHDVPLQDADFAAMSSLRDYVSQMINASAADGALFKRMQQFLRAYDQLQEQPDAREQPAQEILELIKFLKAYLSSLYHSEAWLGAGGVLVDSFTALIYRLEKQKELDASDGRALGIIQSLLQARLLESEADEQTYIERTLLTVRQLLVRCPQRWSQEED